MWLKITAIIILLVVGVSHDFFIVSAQIYLQSGQLRGVEYISYCILNIVLYQLPKVVETRLGILKNKKNHWLQVSTSRRVDCMEIHQVT